MINLDSISMKYVSAESNEELDDGAILECGDHWQIYDLEFWLPELDYDTLQEVQTWLADENHSSYGSYLEVWWD